MKGVIELNVNTIDDIRGSFTKLLPPEINGEKLNFILKDVFTTFSNKGVVRGMHLQTGSSSNTRLIFVLHGVAFDQIIDLREDSETYLEIQRRSLSADDGIGLLVPPGVAHGFQAIEPTQMLYLSDKEHNVALDRGVNALSAPFDWPNPISEISTRDANLPTLDIYLGIKS